MLNFRNKLDKLKNTVVKSVQKAVMKTARVSDVFNNLMNRPEPNIKKPEKGFWWDSLIEPPKFRLNRRHGFRQPATPEQLKKAATKRQRKASKRIRDNYRCIVNNPCLPESLKKLYFNKSYTSVNASV